MMDSINEIFQSLDSKEWLFVGIVLIGIVFANKLATFIHSRPNSQIPIPQMTRFLRGGFVLFLMWPAAQAWTQMRHIDKPLLAKVLAIYVVVSVAFLFYHIMLEYVRRKYGKERDVNGKVQISETYGSRGVGLILAILTTVVVLIGIIQILEFDSLLQAGGVLGFFGVLLALTQGAWAPDIISGLVILNSRLFEEGDVIEISAGKKITAIVFKTKMFHTEILDMVSNHRIMLQNSSIRAMTLHNLSRFASAKGLREQLVFNIGYDVPAQDVKAMFEDVFERIETDQDSISIEMQYEPEVRTLDAGDYAIQWAFFYYVKDVKNVLRTRQNLLALVIKVAGERGIDLSTPTLMVTQSQRAS